MAHTWDLSLSEATEKRTSSTTNLGHSERPSIKNKEAKSSFKQVHWVPWISKLHKRGRGCWLRTKSFQCARDKVKRALERHLETCCFSTNKGVNKNYELFLRKACPFQRKKTQEYTLISKVLSLENTSKVLFS